MPSVPSPQSRTRPAPASAALPTTDGVLLQNSAECRTDQPNPPSDVSPYCSLSVPTEISWLVPLRPLRRRAHGLGVVARYIAFDPVECRAHAERGDPNKSFWDHILSRRAKTISPFGVTTGNEKL